MQTRGRKSLASLTTLKVDGSASRLLPPASITNEEQALFSELVEACDASHFRDSDIPLLVSYIQSTLISRCAAHDPDKITIWEKATRMQATLATRLRLSPQSRADPKTVGRQQPFVGRKPWEDRE